MTNQRVTVMRILPLALAFSFVSVSAMMAGNAMAADPTDPVRDVMKTTEDNWKKPDDDGTYLFSAEPLARLYSKRFQGVYADAAKHPAYDTDNGQPGDPFGYDVITSSQDGCPLQDIAITSAPKGPAMTDVKVMFKQWNCLEDASMKNSETEVHFDVIEEGGKPVIDDIHRVTDGESDSLIEEMQSIAKGE